MIEHAQVSDAEEILMLQKLAYQSEAERYQDYSIPPLTQTQESIQAEFDTYNFLNLWLKARLWGLFVRWNRMAQAISDG